MTHVAVVGGGIAGLTAALRLRQSGHEVTLLEREDQVGGRCRSIRFADRWVAEGAYAFTSRDDRVLALADELRLRHDGQVADLTGAHVERILNEDGSTVDLDLFATGGLAGLETVPLIERLALARTLLPLARMLVRGRVDGPESAAAIDRWTAEAFFRRRSPTFVDRVLEPSLGMFCGWGPQDYSLAVLLAGFGDLKQARKPTSWWTFAEEGVGRLTRTLGERLIADGVEVRTSAPVDVVRTTNDGIEVVPEHGAAFHADAGVIALPGTAVGRLLPDLDRARRSFFDAQRYVPHDIMYAVLDGDLETPPGGPLPAAGIGLCVPAVDGYRLLSNVHWEPQADGTTFLLAETKRRHHSPLRAAPDEEIVRALWDEIARVAPTVRDLPVREQLLCRWDQAISAWPPGQAAALSRFRALGNLPRIAFAGDHLRGSTVGNALITGEQAATELHRTLSGAAPRRGSARAPGS